MGQVSQLSLLPSSHCLFLLTELVAVLNQLRQGAASPCPRGLDTSDTSRYESKTSQPRRHVGSKRTNKIKKFWGADEVGRFFVTGSTDAAGAPSYF